MKTPHKTEYFCEFKGKIFTTVKMRSPLFTFLWIRAKVLCGSKRSYAFFGAYDFGCAHFFAFSNPVETTNNI